MIHIAAYRGKSLISRLIRWQTRSVYSHIGILFSEDLTVRRPQGTHTLRAGNVIEAWKGGVKLSDSLDARHEPGTPVDIFTFVKPLTVLETDAMARFACAQLDKPYDYKAILQFLTREPKDRWRKDKWFCSELAFEACLTAGRELLERCAAWEIPPRDIPRSPVLKLDRTYVTL